MEEIAQARGWASEPGSNLDEADDLARDHTVAEILYRHKCVAERMSAYDL